MIIIVGYSIVNILDECVNTDDGATDVDGYSCQDYEYFPEDCGHYDDDDFKSMTMCCVCKPETNNGKLIHKYCPVGIKYWKGRGFLESIAFLSIFRLLQTR